MVHILILANLRSRVHITLHAALHIRSVFERRAELFFLLLAMRTPPGPIHLHAPIFQTASEAIVLMLRAVAKVVGQPERGHDRDTIDRTAPPLARSFHPRSEEHT